MAARYVDRQNNPTQEFPANPNGSLNAIAGLCNPTGRIFGMMPHPERVALTLQNSWHPDDWGDDGPRRPLPS